MPSTVGSNGGAEVGRNYYASGRRNETHSLVSESKRRQWKDDDTVDEKKERKRAAVVLRCWTVPGLSRVFVQ